MKPASYAPARGDIVWLRFTPQAGHEQSGRRPAFIVSPVGYNRRVGLCLCCPVTSRVKGYPFEVVLPREAGVTGAILCDQVKSIDWKARSASFISALPTPLIREVQARILTLIQ